MEAVDRSTHFKMRIILRLVFVVLLVFTVINPGGAVPDCTRTCVFGRNSKSFDKAPRMRLSILLNSWYNFLVNLFNLLCNLVLTLGAFVSRDKLLPGCSSYLFLLGGLNNCLSLVSITNCWLATNISTETDNSSTLESSIYTLSSAGNIIGYTPIEGSK